MMTSLSAGGGGGSIWAGLRDIDEGGRGEVKRKRGRREEKRGREERPRLALWVEPVFGKWLCHESM